MRRISTYLIMSAVASFVGKIFLNGDDATHSSLINRIREKKTTGPKPKSKTKNVTASVQKLRAKASQSRRESSSSPDNDDDDVVVPKPKRTTWKKKVADSVPTSGSKRKRSATPQKRTKWNNQTRAEWNKQNLKRRARSQGGQTRKRGKWDVASRKRKAPSPQGMEWESLNGKRSRIDDVMDTSQNLDTQMRGQKRGRRGSVSSDDDHTAKRVRNI